ncbi:MAG: hypothetical protein MJE68_17895, partial [Proteobacteria bacterium]|nr:hypothetical protein [Pseudomonadota bacterium]
DDGDGESEIEVKVNTSYDDSYQKMRDDYSNEGKIVWRWNRPGYDPLKSFLDDKDDDYEEESVPVRRSVRLDRKR